MSNYFDHFFISGALQSVNNNNNNNSVASLLISLATTEKSAFYFSDFPF